MSLALSLATPEPDEFKHVKGFCKFQGIIFPLFGKHEMEWPNIIRVILYLSGLVWTFLAIGIISDVFMTGIEKVTSAKRRVVDKVTGKSRTHYVWNDTVANLTLMALGSSAPEILLSLIEIIGGDMFLGDLGAGTIVGSAAFNLLVISAVCVCAMDDGDVRYIKQTKVFMITAFFSVFAYLWLMFILMVTSPNVCTVWEATLTLLFCPLFVFLAYLADKGYFDKADDKYDAQTDGTCSTALSEDMSDEELADVEAQIRKEHGEHLTDAQVNKIMHAQYLCRHTRAYYRHVAMQQHLHAKHYDVTPQGPPDRVVQEIITHDDIEQERTCRRAEIQFAAAKYAFSENCGKAEIMVLRQGCETSKATVKYKTKDGSAKANEDYKPVEGVLVFDSNETSKTVSVDIVDDVKFEADEEFYIELCDPQCEDASSGQVVLGDLKNVTVVVIDDDQPGLLKNKEEEVTVKDVDHDITLQLVVVRVNGARGKIGCSWRTEDFEAKAGQDFEKAQGTCTFEDNQLSANIPINVKSRNRLGNQAFHVILESPENCHFDVKTDGGDEKCICTVILAGKGEKTRNSALSNIRERILSANNVMGNQNWADQFRAAIFEITEADDDEEEGGEAEPPSAMDWFIHIICVPWKLLFACVPPPDYCGGWACFCCSLGMIAIVTAIVGDLANLVGCCLGIKAEITAITFVALGTSLPDTFASKAAAVMDPYADASIGNITGSNSVNVFMGIGLSWLMGAVYWQSQQPSDEWFQNIVNKGYEASVIKDIRDAAGCKTDATNLKWGLRCDSAVFMAPAGSIWFNLMVFCANATCAIGILAYRRMHFGGELGGPKRGFMGQYFTAAFMIGQWFIYIIASSVYAVAAGKKESKEWSLFVWG
jgi:solute carrier family 8 (sodium/calcium exchanger)